MANDLLIKINADAKNAQKAFDDIRDKTEDLEGQLSKVAQVSAVAFAAFTAEVFFSVKAFEEAEQASVQLNNALQNQGIYTEELATSYREYADVVQAKTGIDNDAIIKAQAIAQTYLGQTAITQDLTTAIADLSASMGGDLNGAAEKIARTIGTGTNAFARQGLVISESATEAERMAAVLDFVRQKAGGLAEEFNRADGYTKALATSFGNVQEGLGARFAPAIAAIRQAFVGLFNYLSESPVLLDLAASFVAAGVAVTGIIAFAAAVVPAFLALSAAAATLGVAMNVAFVGIPLLIGAVVGAVTFLALNWETSMVRIKTISVEVVTFVSELFSGLGKVLKGVFTLDMSQITKGLDQIKGSLTAAGDAGTETYNRLTEENRKAAETQNADKKAAADQAAAIERQHQENLRNIRSQEIELMRMQNENASAESIALKQREIETLKALDSQKSAEEIALLQDRHSQIMALQEEQRAEDLARAEEFAAIQQDAKREFVQNNINEENSLSEARLAELRATAETEASIEKKMQDDIYTRRVAVRNQELMDRKKFGAAYAEINKFIQSEEVRGARQAADDLVELSQSKNSTLKGIGKAAAVAQITMKTAEAAMNIYNGFSIIPIVGPALGVAGAAAAIAFGAEKISAVTAANEGGIIPGGGPDRDSALSFLTPGELVVPRSNFDEVVNAVADQRNGGGAGSPDVVAALLRIEEKLRTPQTTIIQGDVQNDDAYIDALVRRISDAVEFRNAQIFGVTT